MYAEEREGRDRPPGIFLTKSQYELTGQAEESNTKKAPFSSPHHAYDTRKQDDAENQKQPCGKVFIAFSKTEIDFAVAICIFCPCFCIFYQYLCKSKSPYWLYCLFFSCPAFHQPLFLLTFYSFFSGSHINLLPTAYIF